MQAKPKSTRGRNALSDVDLRAQYVGPGRRLQVETCQQIAELKQETGGKVNRMLVLHALGRNIHSIYIEYSSSDKVGMMSLYIRDHTVDELAEQVMRRLGTKTKTEAVRIALENELKQADRKPPLAERVKKYQDQIAALGPNNPDFDQKAFMDEMWEY